MTTADEFFAWPHIRQAEYIDSLHAHIVELEKESAEDFEKTEEQLQLKNMRIAKLENDNQTLRGNLEYYLEAFGKASKLLEHYRRSYANLLLKESDGKP